MTPEHRFRLIDHLAADAIARLGEFSGAMARPPSPNEKHAAERIKIVRAEGVKAFELGRKFAENPYPKHDPDHGQWARGWIDAEVRVRAGR